MKLKASNLKNVVVGFIGSGNMAEALIRGVINSGLLRRENLMASDIRSQRRRFISRKYRIVVRSSNKKICEGADVIVLAVKPQDARTVLEEISDYVSQDKLLISIIAGLRTEKIESFCHHVPVIRVMPNTPALVGQGMSVLCRGKWATRHHSRIAKILLRAVGKVVEIREKLMDGVTALSGSGPAYFFYLIEALTEAGEKIGFDRKMALLLASQTALGSAGLLAHTGLQPQELRHKVTSKGGTTEAALKVLEKGKFKQLVNRAVIFAQNRSRQISKIM